MYRYNYTVGDWSCDGHNMSTVFTLQSSHNADNMLQAFENGASIIGFDIRDYAQEYEDNSIDKDAAKAFIALGVEINHYEDEYSLDPASIVEAIIATIKVGNPEIEIELVQGEELVYTFGSVGYGCYSC